MLVSVTCWYSLDPPVYWDDWESPSEEFLMRGLKMRVEAELGSDPEHGSGDPEKGPVIKSLVVKSDVELNSADIEQLGRGLTLITHRPIAPIKEAIERNANCASRVLRWLRAESHDAVLDIDAAARRGKVEVSDSQGRTLGSTLDFPLLFGDLRPTLSHGLFQTAAEHCKSWDEGHEPFLSFELLLEADACYVRFDYRFCLLLSALAIDAGCYCLLKQALRSEAAIKALRDSNVLGKNGKEELKKRLATGSLIKARQWIFKWLEQNATLGALIQAAKALNLEGGLQKGILDEIGELNKKRNKLVHPRGWVEVEQADANRARSLARRFLQLSGQLSGWPKISDCNVKASPNTGELQANR